jgi:hypothetical protein
MLLPTKHTTIEQSLLGFGCYILQIIDENNTLDLIWKQYQDDFDSKVYHVKQTFDNLILTLLFLYTIGAIEEYNGEIKKCN